MQIEEEEKYLMKISIFHIVFQYKYLVLNIFVSMNVLSTKLNTK